MSLCVAYALYLLSFINIQIYVGESLHTNVKYNISNVYHTEHTYALYNRYVRVQAGREFLKFWDLSLISHPIVVLNLLVALNLDVKQRL